MINTFKRQFVIAQLRELGVNEVDGKSLENVEYKVLLKTLALKKSANQ